MYGHRGTWSFLVSTGDFGFFLFDGEITLFPVLMERTTTQIDSVSSYIFKPYITDASPILTRMRNINGTCPFFAVIF
jgi:hypothetical protein